MSREHSCFNSLALFSRGNYEKLKKLKSSSGTWEKTWEALSAAGTKLPDPESERRKLGDSNIQLFLPEDPEYPPALREIPWPPFGIYSKGNIGGIPEHAVAIVGTRKATIEGKSTASRFARELAARGIGIISGLALGIDGAAHEGCLESRGWTAGVLGNGLDSIYPRTHERLSKKILEAGGSVISEYPPGSESLPHRFLERNRIISGLSRGVLIIEAPLESGSLVTGRFALEQNREVFVIPGPISHPNFRGSNQLIRNGAQLVASPEDILESLGLGRGPETLRRDLPLSEEARVILETLERSAQPLSVDKIVEATNLRAHIVNQTLSFLVIQNKIRETNEGYAP
ncbi:DNA-protecting protein DprA [Candidatus Parcubacteria bacterium]|nr:MAG: DNA-protecting protein DprA [Candidatus Parcubacteria bacterium]